MYPWVREKKKRYLYKDYYIIMAMPLQIKESNVPQGHIERGLIVSKENNLVVILLLVKGI